MLEYGANFKLLLLLFFLNWIKRHYLQFESAEYTAAGHEHIARIHHSIVGNAHGFRIQFNGGLGVGYNKRLAKRGHRLVRGDARCRQTARNLRQVGHRKAKICKLKEKKNKKFKNGFLLSLLKIIFW